MRPVPAEINHPHPGGVLLIGRDPGEQEVDYRRDEQAEKDYPDGRPFVGPAGQELDRVLSFLGLRRQEVNITNLVPFRPPENLFKAHSEEAVNAGLEALQSLAAKLKPSLIISLGNEASWGILGGLWPTAGRGAFGAKGIEERRGYFWDSPFGTVLTTLHPSGVLHKPIPGKYLLEHDFKRARKWLEGKLPRDEIPQPRRLTMEAAMKLSKHSLLGWDIETKWGMNALAMSGFCGDDLMPYIGMYPKDQDAIWYLLKNQVTKCGHNGVFDLSMMKLVYNLDVQGYRHDSQHMWWALEPELAGQDDLEESQGRTRMTRKALAFLATIYDFNIPWWKDYPSKGPWGEAANDPDHDEKLRKVNTGDIWLTRQLASCMLPEIEREKVGEQYTRSIEMIPFTVRTHLRGIRVNKELVEERVETLDTRAKMLKSQSAEVALKYIEEKKLSYFEDTSKCTCCGGGKVQAQHCLRCAQIFVCGLPKKITKAYAETFGFKTIKAFKESWPQCEECKGTGKIKSYHFNPMSEQQMKYLLFEALGVPKSYHKKKVILDEAALKKLLRWCTPKEE